MADIQIPYLPQTEHGDFDLKLQEVIDILRYYLSEHDTSLTTLEASLTWTEVSSFSNSWVNFGSPYYNAAYSKDAHGWVHLRGQIKDGTNDAKCFTLPTGYRPSSELNLTISANGPAAARLSIETDGDVIPASDGAVTGRISLDNVNFYVG